jgi:hypothetical protein
MPTQQNLDFANFHKCEFGQLTMYRSTRDLVIHGARDAYEQFVQYMAENLAIVDETSESSLLFDVMRSQFNVEPSLEGFATYSETVVNHLFPGLKSNDLPSLINVHLHEHFLRQHPVLAIIDPIEDSRLTLFREEVTSLANSIALCPSSPFVGSCPPGFTPCKPCRPASLMRFRSLGSVPRNAYLLGIVPHPYSFLSYVHQKSNLDPRFVRETGREAWVAFVTADIVDKHSGGYQRIETLKKFVDSERVITFEAKVPSGMWQTWEELHLDGLESTLGFHVDMVVEDKKEMAADLNSVAYLAKARVLLQTPESRRDMVESWNLAWTELWYFIRALQRRRRSEQLDLVGGFGF